MLRYEHIKTYSSSLFGSQKICEHLVLTHSDSRALSLFCDWPRAASSRGNKAQKFQRTHRTLVNETDNTSDLLCVGIVDSACVDVIGGKQVGTQKTQFRKPSASRRLEIGEALLEGQLGFVVAKAGPRSRLQLSQ